MNVKIESIQALLTLAQRIEQAKESPIEISTEVVRAIREVAHAIQSVNSGTDFPLQPIHYAVDREGQMSNNRGAKGTFKCQNCGDDFLARLVDRKRGWAKFCSKSCKAIKQEQRTGQYRDYMAKKDGYYEVETFSNAHLFDNTEL